MPRTAIMVDGLEIGGSERQALLLAGALRARAVEISILSLGGDGPLAAVCRKQNIPVDAVSLRYPYCRWRLPANLWRARRLLRCHRPVTVIGFGSVSNLYAPLLKPIAGVLRAVWFQRNAGLHRPPWRLERMAQRRVDAFAANSPAGVSFLTSFGIARDQIALIPNGVRLPAPVDAPDAWHARLGIPSGAPLVCMLANLREPKDPLTLLRAWAQAISADTPPDRRPHLVLAGRADALTNPVRAAIADLKLDDCVHLPGCVEDVAGLLAACDFAVFASRSEGLPNGVIEPMAAGLAVGATDLPGIRFALGPEGARGLAPVGDVPALAAVLSSLLSDPVLRSDWGARNRARAEHVFAVDRIAEQVMKLVTA